MRLNTTLINFNSSIIMKTTSIQSYFYEAQSQITKSPKVVVKVKGHVQRNYVNTFTPKFSYKNHEGEIISPNTCFFL